MIDTRKTESQYGILPFAISHISQKGVHILNCIGRKHRLASKKLLIAAAQVENSMVLTTTSTGMPFSENAPGAAIPSAGGADTASSPSSILTLKEDQMRLGAVQQSWQDQFSEWNKRFEWLQLSITNDQITDAITNIDPSRSRLDGLSLTIALARGSIFKEDLSIGPILAAAAMFRNRSSITGDIEENSKVLPSIENILTRFRSPETCEMQRRLLCAVLLRGEGQFTPTDRQKASLLSALQHPELPQEAITAVTQRFRL